MAYKKYIKREGKIYGPYSYKSVKKDGKVITQYLGKSSEEKKKNFSQTLFLIGGIFLLLSVFVLLFNLNLTGNVVLSMQENYNPWEQITGKVKINLEPEEFIPASTKVVIFNGEDVEEYFLKELVDVNSTQGYFYLKGKNISGEGEGYGFENFEYPVVSFVLNIFSEKKEINETAGIPEETEEVEIEIEQPVEETEEEIVEPIQEEVEDVVEEIVEAEEETEVQEQEMETETEEEVAEEEAEAVEEIGESAETEAMADEPAEQISEKSSEESAPESAESAESITGDIVRGFVGIVSKAFLSITGQATLELEEQIKGEVSKDKVFNYTLKEGQTAEIDFSSEPVDLVVNGKEVVVTTDYVGEETELLIDLESLNLIAQGGDFIVSLIYEGEELVSVKEEIELEINETLMNVTEVDELNINTTQYGAVLGKPVKWKKEIKLDEPKNISVELPKQAENINVYKIEEGEGEAEQSEIVGFENETENIGKIINKTDTEEISEVETETETEPEIVEEEISENKVKITGMISAEFNKEKFSFKKFFNKIAGAITGRLIEVEEGEDSIEVIINENATEFEINYETPGPVAEEKNIPSGKEIVVSSGVHYENILAYTEMPESVSLSKIKLYNVENGSRTLTKFDAYDSNGNKIEPANEQQINESDFNFSISEIIKVGEGNESLVRYITWVVPHLSEQTYELIIKISDAEHLDSNRSLIENIYAEVYEKDGIWSDAISDGDYVRVTFEQELDNTKDITFYGRGNGSIEVYSDNCSGIVEVDEIEVPKEILAKKKRIDEIRRLLNE